MRESSKFRNFSHVWTPAFAGVTDGVAVPVTKAEISQS
jgi:hypothetical protein